MNLDINKTLKQYAELLAECVSVRLTGTRDADEIFNTHIQDGLEALKFLRQYSNAQIIDVGSGGGLPGIVWAVCRPDLNIILLDSIGKKCRASQEIIEKLNLNNIKAICSRSEEFAKLKSNRERFDLACARAVADAGVTAELLSPLVKVQGSLMTFKGAKLEQELEQVNHKWRCLGLSEPEINYYGGDNSSKSILIWRKISKCPKIFPRKPGDASNKFWWTLKL
ncbi:MAG: 16S rRNA (guanine(527)-N(7))-methyltransferase RsmG [Synergistaceae bacterium]|nr:16S rRNA (guanine(527)-N(7))-methyltransferase RsmG [Synergistaceae bacterium]